jgi:hypothetical protein
MDTGSFENMARRAGVRKDKTKALRMPGVNRCVGGVLQLDNSSSRQRLQNSDVKERRKWVKLIDHIPEFDGWKKDSVLVMNLSIDSMAFEPARYPA